MESTKTTKKVKTEYIVLSIVFLIFLITLGIYLFQNNSPKDNKQISKISTPKETQTTPTTVKKRLPSGKQIYNYSHGSAVTGPKPSKLIVDPQDPKLGETLTFTVDIQHSSPITKVAGILITDHQEVENILTLSNGNNQNGTWTTSWKVDDSYNLRYQIDLIADSNDSSFTGGLTFR